MPSPTVQQLGDVLSGISSLEQSWPEGSALNQSEKVHATAILAWPLNELVRSISIVLKDQGT